MACIVAGAPVEEPHFFMLTFILELKLRQRWNEANDKGICRYQLNIQRNEKMRGKYGFILQVSYIAFDLV